MKLVLTTFLTIDGIYQAPGGPEEDPSGAFEHGGWSVPYGDDDFGRFMTDVIGRAEAFLLGRRTYEIFASYWPKMTAPDDLIADRLNRLPKYVPTATLTSADWANTTLLGGDLGREVAALKQRDGGELQIHGSGALAGALLRLGLIDTMHLLTFPVVVGTGKRLFTPDLQPTAFTLTESRTTGTGVVIDSYERVGAPTYGSYERPEFQ
ncbi:dihydrofolate reductase family protein [Embleya sp. NPDC020886]|uniref:dihydrofolate reductase family protein n=1 Tax=Embleya sp. NPDC020886 TaxID=3363980 RepID=UPI0037A8946B